MMIDWDLYEGGWVVNSNDNPGLFYYLCQIETGVLNQKN